jgi:hypothetical protein
MTALLPWWWRWAALVLVIVASAGFGAIKMHAHDQTRYEALQGDFAGYRAQVSAEGKIAQRRADAQAAAAKLAKEQTDAENKAARNLDRQRIASLRWDADHRGAYSLPAAPADARRADLACFDRAEFERAGGAALGRLRAIADQGDAATLDLNSARAWALRLDRNLRAP